MYAIRTYWTLAVFFFASYSLVDGVRKKLVMNSNDYARLRQQQNRQNTGNRGPVGSRGSSRTGNSRVNPFGGATDIVVLQSGQAPVSTLVDQLLQGPSMNVSTLRRLYPWIKNPKPRGRPTAADRRWKVPGVGTLSRTLGLNNYNEFVAQRGLPDINGRYKVKVQQRWRGIRCYTSSLVVEQNDYGEVYTDTMTGKFLSDIETDIRDYRPRISERQAINYAKRHKGHSNYLTENEKGKLVVYDKSVGDNMKAMLVYIVNYYVPAAGTVPLTQRVQTTGRPSVVRGTSRQSITTRRSSFRQTGANSDRKTGTGSGKVYVPGQYARRNSWIRSTSRPTSASGSASQPSSILSQSSSKRFSPVDSTRPYFIIDAQNGKVLETWEGLAKFAWESQSLMTGNRGSGYKSVSKLVLRNSATNVCRHSSPLSGTETIDVFDRGQWAHTDFNCNDGNTQQYDNTNSAASPKNNALHWGLETFNLLKRMNPNFDFPTGGNGIKIEVHHDGFRAEFSGSRILLGDGIPGILYPQTEPDWIAHETAHVFTEFSSDLETKGESGALSEAFSDMAASTLMHQHNIRSPYVIGRSTLVDTSRTAGYRDLCNPRNTKMFSYEPPKIPPLNYQDMLSVGTEDLHLASAVMGRAYCILSTKPDWTPYKAMRVFLVANYLYWGPKTTYADAACGLIKATKDLRGGAKVVDMYSTMEQVGVKCSTQA